MVQVVTVAPIGEHALSSNEALYGFNQADKLFPATVLVADDSADGTFIRQHFAKEQDMGVAAS